MLWKQIGAAPSCWLLSGWSERELSASTAIVGSYELWTCVHWLSNRFGSARPSMLFWVASASNVLWLPQPSSRQLSRLFRQGSSLSNLCFLRRPFQSHLIDSQKSEASCWSLCFSSAKCGSRARPSALLLCGFLYLYALVRRPPRNLASCWWG